MAAGDMKSSRLIESNSGERWAGKEMREQHSGNPVNASLMAVVTLHPDASPVITRTGIVANDTVDNLDASPPVAPVSTEDKATLVVQVEHSAVAGELDITPIGYNEAGDAVLTIFKTEGADMAAPNWRRGSGAGNYLSKVLAWDIYGVQKISIAVSGYGGATTAVVKAWLI